MPIAAVPPSAGAPGEADHLRSIRVALLERIAEACSRAGRDPRAVTLVAVTKTVPAARVAEAVRAGFDVLGENRVQEAAEKIPAIGGRAASPDGSNAGRAPAAAATAATFAEAATAAPVAAFAPAPQALPAVRWHLVGPLQSNKARRAVELFDVIETVDSAALARRLDRLAADAGRGRIEVLLEVNIDRDPAKSGFAPETVASDLPAILDLPRLRILGLMSVGRLVARAEEARPTFRRLRDLSERLRAGEPRLGPALSMGMTDDFEVAIEEGATIVRIGRAIFGERPAG